MTLWGAVLDTKSLEYLKIQLIVKIPILTISDYITIITSSLVYALNPLWRFFIEAFFHIDRYYGTQYRSNTSWNLGSNLDPLSQSSNSNNISKKQCGIVLSFICLITSRCYNLPTIGLKWYCPLKGLLFLWAGPWIMSTRKRMC
jgi:hypothetical protein